MKLLAILLLLCWVVCALPAAGQTPRADSLRQLLRTPARPDTTRVRWLQALAQELKTTDAPQATQLSAKALQLARQLADPTGEGQALLALSMLHRRQTDYANARRYAHEAQRFFAGRADRWGLARAGLQLSRVDKLQGDLVPALAVALKALALTERTGDGVTQASLQANIGDIYCKMDNYAEALPMLRAALKSSRQAGDRQGVSLALSGLGNAYQRLKNWPRALFYHQQTLQLSRELGDASSETVDETNLAEVYGLQGNQAEALAHGRRARALVGATHDQYNLPSVELMLARGFVLAGQPDSAVALARHALALSQQSRSNENIRNAGDILAQAYAQRRDFAQAYRYRNLQMAYNDTLSGEDTQRRTSALRYGYELDKKQAQIVLLKKDQEIAAQKAYRQRQQMLAALVGLGGVVLVVGLLLRNIFLKQRANRRLGEKNVEIAAHRDDLDRTLTELQTTQNQLVQREKMASLGELTAGVAHEMQNPLNFVTNFADLSVELVAELEAELAKERLSAEGGPAIGALVQALAQNQAKIHQHGHRADRIVKNMLEHARTRSGECQPTDLNALADEYLRLAYHGWRAKNKDFNAELKTDFDPRLGPVPVVPQDLSRVLLNLLTNAFYAVAEKAKTAGPAYRPQVAVATRRTGGTVRVRVRDNGNGIPAAVREKIFQPFFTTKPTGEGTGLGLSLSYDIIAKGHGGTLAVASQEGEFTEFTITLPAAAAAE
ncbi:ATP-binding protein [Hymenobacter nivis]|uniref:histidine kinase n=1 Tax=Hymenobacter nivis TaxID=1850093 RepID=A0A502HE69_9BACT|nr:ATP-binding protein [Hymenobacter nivis]TPG71726.1 two-component sensor histidine kinase [Hymenobacter nivis]